MAGARVREAVEMTDRHDWQPVTGDAWHGVRYFCTTRSGGVSAPPYDSLNLGLHVGDDLASVHENRRRLRAMLPGDPLWLQQVHGVDVVDADVAAGVADAQGAAASARQGGVASPLSASGSMGQAAAPGVSVAPVGDAAVTCRPGRVLAIMTADCLPVVIADVQGRTLGVAHAGWRGLAGGVLEQTLAQLRRRCPQAQGWRAWIGPAIGPQAFEVGRDVFQAFVDQRPEAGAYFRAGVMPGKWLADLAGLAAMRLRAAGVDQVQASGLCTVSQAGQFYSYRRHSVTGRMATCAWLCDE